MSWCEVLRSPRVYLVGERQDYPSKPVKFSPPPSVSCKRRSVGKAGAPTTLTVESPPAGYRKSVGICLVNSSNKVFTGSKIWIPDSWQMPQGGIDEGEDVRNAVMRELREETGVTSAQFVGEAPYWLTYDFPRRMRERLSRKWGTNYKGQAQKWFLLKFAGEDAEINLFGEGLEKAELKQWTWLSPDVVVDHAVDFRKPVYQQVIRLFSPYFQANGNVELCGETNGSLHIKPRPLRYTLL